MKYQSEIIKEIIDTRGHEKSSLHYESECIESWIDENKGSYPKLCDYQSEWLNYINENPLGEFPYETLTDVTKATINNVVPYAYKSAILKGNTLSNKQLSVIGNVSATINNDKSITMNGNSNWHHVDYDTSDYVGNKVTFFVLFSENTIGDDLSYFQFDGYGFSIENKVMNTNSFKFYGTITGKSIRFGLKPTVKNGSITFRTMLLDGDYSNHDIPYFEGIKSVKTPVLTTTGKNLFDKNQNNLNKGIMPSTWSDMGIDFIFKSGTYYAKDDNSNVKYDEYLIDGSINKELAGSNGITVTDNTLKIRIKLFRTKSDETFEEHYETFRIGTSFEDIVSYEPYKSNILTANEPVELRGIGEVQDTLDCLTGELTERIGEIVLDGVSIIPTVNRMKNQNNTIAFDFKKSFPSLNTSLIHSLNDTFPDYSGDVLYNSDVEGLSRGWNSISVRINKNRLAQANVEGFKQWLQSNPITVQYQLATESVKTVDLTVVNQDGENVLLKPIEGTMHLSTSSETINPLFSGEIPVEAITQNLASFIEE